MGNNIIQAAIVYNDPKLKDLDIKGEHTIHPYSFSRTINKAHIMSALLVLLDCLFNIN